MTIADLDKNFQLPELNIPDVEWFDASEEPFSLHGIYFIKKKAFSAVCLKTLPIT